MRQTAFVKISGDLLDKSWAIARLSQLSREYFLVVCVGGGTQISAAFRELGYPVEFGPQGRITKTFAERQLARNILEINQAVVQDLLAQEHVNATVIIPVLDIASVLCHINGDVFATLASGFDRTIIFTLEARVEEKRAQFAANKNIEVEGF